MTDYRIEAASREEWAERALRAEDEKARLREALTAWSPETNTTPWCLLGIEQMRAFEASTGQIMRLRQDGEWHRHSGQCIGVISDTYRILPIPERAK